MIKIEHLKPSDVGRWVLYTPDHGKAQKGRLKSWREGGVYRDVAHVVYHCANWDRFKEYGGYPTFPEDLSFCDPIDAEMEK